MLLLLVAVLVMLMMRMLMMLPWWWPSLLVWWCVAASCFSLLLRHFFIFSCCIRESLSAAGGAVWWVFWAWPPSFLFISRWATVIRYQCWYSFVINSSLFFLGGGWLGACIQLYSPFGRIKIKYKNSQTRTHNKKHTEHRHARTLVRSK